jgi:hypothetical protein
MRSAHYNIEMSIHLEVAAYEEAQRLHAREAEQQRKTDRERADWWKRWEVSKLAQRAGLRCIQAAPPHAGWGWTDDLVF